jgi:hypothetical protein
MSLLSQHICALSSGRRQILTAEQKVKLLEMARNRKKNGEEVTLEWIFQRLNASPLIAWNQIFLGHQNYGIMVYSQAEL